MDNDERRPLLEGENSETTSVTKRSYTSVDIVASARDEVTTSNDIEDQISAQQHVDDNKTHASMSKIVNIRSELVY